MNLAAVARMLAGIVAVYTVVQLAPLMLALFGDGSRAAAGGFEPRTGFLAGIGVGTAVALLLFLAGRRHRGEVFRREAILVASSAWVVVGVLAAIPLQYSGVLPDPCDAVFEAISGMTTCGGTVLGSGGNVAIENVPESLLLWRAMLQWLGGIGIVLVFVVLLPGMGMSGKNLLSSESVGVPSEGFLPRLHDQARTIALVYLLLTLLCTVMLVLFGGMSWFDATCHAFTAMATGGFSTRSSLAAFDSVAVELVLTLFMFIAGCNFVILAASVRQRWRGDGTLLQSPEFRLYLLFTIASIAVIAVDLLRHGLGVGDALRQASFNSVSTISCTGYATANYQAWPPLAVIVLFLGPIVGGCSGSTSGGFKQIRLLVTLKLLALNGRMFARPRSVERIKVGGEVLTASAISSIVSMVLLWLLTILVGGAVLALDSRLDFLGALSTSASMLGCCGPAMTAVQPEAVAHGLPAYGQVLATIGPDIGPLGGYGDLHDWTKLAMALETILGRLELLTLLAVLSPSFWRR